MLPVLAHLRSLGCSDADVQLLVSTSPGGSRCACVATPGLPPRPDTFLSHLLAPRCSSPLARLPHRCGSTLASSAAAAALNCSGASGASKCSACTACHRPAAPAPTPLAWRVLLLVRATVAARAAPAAAAPAAWMVPGWGAARDAGVCDSGGAARRVVKCNQYGTGCVASAPSAPNLHAQSSPYK
jgi:hypothetical protein